MALILILICVLIAVAVDMFRQFRIERRAKKVSTDGAGAEVDAEEPSPDGWTALDDIQLERLLRAAASGHSDYNGDAPVG